jgi:hypothetical protein
MAGIARSIELYQLAYSLAWPYVSDFQKNADPNVAVRLHDSIRRRLNQGATEPVLIASEALKDLELNGQVTMMNLTNSHRWSEQPDSSRTKIATAG